MSLTDTQVIVSIAGGLVVVFGFVINEVRKQWGKTEAQFRIRMADQDADHRRDIAYFERRDRDQAAEIHDLRDRLERCEERWHTPTGTER